MTEYTRLTCPDCKTTRHYPPECTTKNTFQCDECKKYNFVTEGKVGKPIIDPNVPNFHKRKSTTYVPTPEEETYVEGLRRTALERGDKYLREPLNIAQHNEATKIALDGDEPDLAAIKMRDAAEHRRPQSGKPHQCTKCKWTQLIPEWQLDQKEKTKWRCPACHTENDLPPVQTEPAEPTTYRVVWKDGGVFEVDAEDMSYNDGVFAFWKDGKWFLHLTQHEVSSIIMADYTSNINTLKPTER